MTYIVAVSGGVDSVVLLDQLVRSGGHDCIVAHVDHGIRPTSADDEAFVRALAATYGVSYETTRLELGPDAPEAVARERRYAWLRSLQELHHADAIVTAHHQDDVIETMILNLIRGTGWRGLSALRERSDLHRPLLATSRVEIVRYAIDHELDWREDETNDDVRYTRNYVRYRYVQRMTNQERQQWIALYDAQVSLTNDIDDELAHVAQAPCTTVFSRYWLTMIGPEVWGTVLAYSLGRSLMSAHLRQLRHFVLTARPGKRLQLDGFSYRVTVTELIVSTSDIC